MIETIEAGKNQVSRRAVIQAPVEELFDLVANPHRHHGLDGSGSVGEVVSGTERMVDGEPFQMQMKMFGISYRTTSIPTQVRENEIAEWRVAGRQKWRWEFTSLGPDSTEVTETWDVRGVGLAPVFNLMRMNKRNAKGIEETLRQLQEKYA